MILKKTPGQNEDKPEQGDYLTPDMLNEPVTGYNGPAPGSVVPVLPPAPGPTTPPPTKGPGPGGLTPHEASVSESPRERAFQATPRRPTEPTPMENQVTMPPPPPSPMPFAPMPSEGTNALIEAAGAGPQRRNLFGKAGGLLGGGLGNAFDLNPSEANDPISSLIQALQSKKGLGSF